MNVLGHARVLPILALALLAIGTSVQVGCGSQSEDTGNSEDAVGKGSPTGDGYGYGGYGYGGYGYGGYGGYGYGGYGGYGSP